MARQASFYDPRRATPQDRIAREYMNDPRAALAASLMEGDSRPAYGGVWEGVARAGSKVAGALLQKQMQKERLSREEAAQSTLARALMGDQINPAGAEQPMGGDVSMQPVGRTLNTQADMARILAGNPDTAGMAFDLRMQEMARQQALADEQRRMGMEQEQWQTRFAAQQEAQEAARQQQFEQQKALRGIPQAAAPDPGMSDRAFEQQMAMLNAQMEAKRAAKGVQLTPGQKAVDETAARDLTPFVVSGGFADVQKGLGQLRKVIGELDKGGVTGTGVGWTPNAVLGMFNERAVDTQQLVEEVVQRNLRTILGAQFTEKEGTRLIERAYNPYLDEKVNKRRVNALITSMEQAAQAKQEAWEYMQENGTLKGFEGNLWSMQDFERAIDEAGGGSRETGSEVDDLVNKYRSR